jgi:hypothetical protein
MVFFFRRFKPLDLFVIFATNAAVALYIWPPFIKEFEKSQKKASNVEETPKAENSVAETKISDSTKTSQ